jgi:hypothetical protein
MACRKNLVQVAPAIEYANNFCNVVLHAIKDDMRTCRNRSKAVAHFIAGSTGERMLFKQSAHFVDFTYDFVSSVPTCDIHVVVPDFGEIGARFRRPIDRSPRIDYAVRSVVVENLRRPAARLRRHRANECPCRSRRASGVVSRRTTTAADRSVLDPRQADSRLPLSLFPAFSPSRVL